MNVLFILYTGGHSIVYTLDGVDKVYVISNYMCMIHLGLHVLLGCSCGNCRGPKVHDMRTRILHSVVLLTTNILHSLRLVSDPSSSAGAARRFADYSSTDMSCWVRWVWNYHSELQECRTDQLPTATTGCAAECANAVSHSFIK